MLNSLILRIKSVEREKGEGRWEWGGVGLGWDGWCIWTIVNVAETVNDQHRRREAHTHTHTHVYT